MTVETKMIEHLPFTTERVIAARARIGVIVLATDYTLEHELRQMITLPGVDVYHARIANSPQITPETLRAMLPLITSTANLILPGDTLDVLAFACTSASIVLGTETVAENLKAAKPGAATTNPAFAAFNAFRALGAKRIALLTPYSRAVNDFVQRSVEEAGFEVPVFGSFNEPHDPTVASIDTPSLKAAIARITEGNDVDAVFISCTSVRIAASVAAIEAELGVPVTSSNHALAWHCLRLAGVTDKMPQHGRLFTV
ncbi:aspartate/glutamate racemase family protein [Albidovulum sediminicola]|uniref:Aspartate/glutamate racemase family protein n=1 Tax=Albidovulum sediminicola TaxID=2984331 RepID=A0ABT2Z4Q9_9RHOB|nr:aspartate/glutamate racemase family protein [Defluviimonas sp. WL0075]MCV2866130.1 aspartate/glutamate racemase family protein [Defluviimonas sp. WL0075]